MLSGDSRPWKADQPRRRRRGGSGRTWTVPPSAEHDVALPGALATGDRPRRARVVWAARSSLSRYVHRHEAHPPRPHRPRGLPPLPGHDDVRLPVRRGHVVRHPRPRAEARHHLPRHRRRLPARRRRSTRVGRTEEIVGRWLRGHGATTSSLATKCFGPHGPAAVGPGQLAASTSSTPIDASPAPAADRLRRPLPAPRLRPRHADRRDAAAPSTTSCAPARSRYVGCSNFLAYQVARALGRSEVLGVARFDSRAAALQPAVPRDRARAAAAVRRGGHRRDPLQPARRRLAHRQAPAGGAPDRGHALHPRHRRPSDVPGPLLARRASSTPSTQLRPLADEAGMSLAALAVAWVLANPAITSPIIGASRPEQLDDSLRRRSTARSTPTSRPASTS